ncbi:MAG: DUF4112 domain-containing protein [Polyangiales bacterium]
MEQRHPSWAEALVRFLDDGVRIPGTNFRFGMDALIGLVPGVGDASTAVGSLSLFWLAIKRDVPRPVLVRMAINVAIDSLVGAVPVLGDVFDLFFKSNRRNLNLIRAASGETPVRRSRLGDYLAITGIALLIGCAFALPILVVAFVIDAIRG